ncbi:MAG: DUF1445 domain-containing protein [Planctomycetes bacterium]|nr:DUF1445 domain-containing protein [Planctomycetota bacterium]
MGTNLGAVIREQIRRGEWQGNTVGRAGRQVQAGLVVLPGPLAYDFLLFCQRNPRPCPLLEVTDAGDPEPRGAAPGADLRTDVSRYSVWRRGKLQEEVTDIRAYWKEDTVGFLIGSSLTFSDALERAGCRSSTGITLYKTELACRPAGVLRGPMVVTLRTLPPDRVARAVQVTTRFQATHGAPIHIGNPAAIGIRDLADTLGGGPAPQIPPGHVPLFWACSVTPQVVAQESKIDFMITHTSGHGFVTDWVDEDLAMP